MEAKRLSSQRSGSPMNQSAQADDARRVVAAINACRGIPTVLLEEDFLQRIIATHVGELQCGFLRQRPVLGDSARFMPESVTSMYFEDSILYSGFHDCKLWIQLADLYVASCLELETAPRVKEFAARLRLRREQVSRAFSKSTGTAIHVYFERAQFEYSKRLLAETELSVTTVAYRSGFENRRTFYRFFQRVTRQTPAKFRERARNAPRSAVCGTA
jgi:AraC-like DNA-binding protein